MVLELEAAPAAHHARAPGGSSSTGTTTIPTTSHHRRAQSRLGPLRIRLLHPTRSWAWAWVSEGEGRGGKRWVHDDDASLTHDAHTHQRPQRTRQQHNTPTWLRRRPRGPVLFVVVGCGAGQLVSSYLAGPACCCCCGPAERTRRHRDDADGTTTRDSDRSSSADDDANNGACWLPSSINAHAPWMSTAPCV